MTGKAPLTKPHGSLWDAVVERVAQALYEKAMEERGFRAVAWDGPDTPQRTEFRGTWREDWRVQSRYWLEPLRGDLDD